MIRHVGSYAVTVIGAFLGSVAGGVLTAVIGVPFGGGGSTVVDVAAQVILDFMVATNFDAVNLLLLPLLYIGVCYFARAIALDPPTQ
jgi:hypothetical protein